MIGAAYTLTGLVGFAVTGFDGFAAPEGPTLLGFEIKPLHNIVHLLIGAAGLALWNRMDQAKVYGWLSPSGTARPSCKACSSPAPPVYAATGHWHVGTGSANTWAAVATIPSVRSIRVMSSPWQVAAS